MKRLIIDHFRRWWWVLTPIAIVLFFIGWYTDLLGEKILSATLIFDLYAGVMLITFDFARGIARPIAALPLTAQQIGRAWWLAAVGIPALVLSIFLYLGASTYYYFHPDTVFPANRLVLTSIFNLLWLGTGFTLVLGAKPGFYGSVWERARNIFLASSFGLMIGGGFFVFFKAPNNSILTAILFGVCALSTVAGWFCAGQFVQNRASFRLAAFQSRNPRGQHRAPDGYGGIPFLIGTTFIRNFLMYLMMVAVFWLVLAWLERGKSSGDTDVFNMVPMSSGQFSYILFIFILPVVMQLRFLRTLPISATNLAAVMLAIMLLPITAIGALMAGVAGLTSGLPAAISALKVFTFCLAPASLLIFLGVWRGSGKDSFVIAILVISACQFIPVFFHGGKIPFGVTGAIAGISAVSSFLLMRYVLLNGSHTYRVQTLPFGNAFGGSVGR